MKEKINYIIYSLTAAGLFFMLLNSCSEDENSPVMDTTAIIKISQSSAICRGFILNNGGAEISEKGFCWSTNQSPGITDSKIIVKSDSLNFTDTITGLSPNITYYVRSYALNNKGITYGGEQSFTLWINTPGPNVTDIDGNKYTSVKIGSQVWMVENLRTTKYRNGDLIGTTTPATLDLRSENAPRYQWAYDGNENNVPAYGRLYSWHAVSDSRDLAPIGWHVASKADWAKLVDYLDGQVISGGKLKEAGATHWINPNTGATNESGFYGLPSGIRLESGPFINIGFVTYWWALDESECIYCVDQKKGIDWYLGHSFSAIYWSSDIGSLGNSVRCVMN
jgi:uncharacterized protein (TIGR02145 family)